MTLKDHKNFKNSPTCRLINPAKSEIEVVSKEYINSINRVIRKKNNVNQWRNTDAIVTWFKSIESKNIISFLKFHITDFCNSIWKDFLINAVSFSISTTSINGKIIKDILHALKSLLFNKNEVWVKKDNPDFDVTMGSFDGVKNSELVRLYFVVTLTKELSDKKLVCVEMMD